MERNRKKLNGMECNGLVVFTLHYGRVLNGLDVFLASVNGDYECHTQVVPTQSR